MELEVTKVNYDSVFALRVTLSNSNNSRFCDNTF